MVKLGRACREMSIYEELPIYDKIKGDKRRKGEEVESEKSKYT